MVLFSASVAHFEKFYFVSVLTGEPYEVTEEEFFNGVGFDRQLIPCSYNSDFSIRYFHESDGHVIGFSVRGRVQK